MAFAVTFLAIVAELCEDPAVRTDMHPVLWWQRAAMFVVGGAVLEVYRYSVSASLAVLFRWLVGYFICYVVMAQAIHYFAHSPGFY